MTTSLSRYAKILKLLSHPVRLEILHLLRHQSMFVQDMQVMIGRPQAFISQQLQLLRTAGIVETERIDRRVAYKLKNETIIRGSDLLRHALGLAKEPGTKNIFRDPVCGMSLQPQTASFRHVYQRRPFYFCASGCLKRFRRAPALYTK